MAGPPADIEIYRADGPATLLLVCDHAGNRVPRRLGDLGLAPGDLGRHIAHDIGAAAVTYHLADLLDAPAILCHVSRLVIDVNRPPSHPTAMPEVSDGIPIPANRDLSPEEGRQRLFGSFVPYHRAIARRLARFRREGRVPSLIAVHSFTPHMKGEVRPWQIGVLSGEDRRLAQPMLAALRARGGVNVGDNEPYSGHGALGFTCRFHAERPGLPHVMLELRHDLIASPDGARRWAETAADALRLAVAEMSAAEATGRPLGQRHRGGTT